MTLVRLFGLVIDSEVPLPNLLPAAAGAIADVHIRRGRVGTDADLVIPEAGLFRVRDGREIIVETNEGVSDRNLRLFLLGSAMGLILHQRGLFPLHANAVELDGRAIAVAGATGAGKSTLAAWFSRSGHRIVGDDVVALKATACTVLAYPGPPRVRLWREAMERFGIDTNGLEPSYADDTVEKWDLPVAGDALVADAVPLGAVYVLEDGADIAITRLGGGAAAATLFDHTYRGSYADRQAEWRAEHFRAVAAVAKSVPVFRLERPRDLSLLEALGRALLAHAVEATARTAAEDRSAAPAPDR
ncbi:hypothetical protein V6R86_09590 [Sphingomonas kaistensis]|uniref:HPr kinase/phosphorylase C-terminal domain-containing protein n=1 Tax=Sphingomonas kaistensis TaxID=298708 RepID=A0ABZ2G518_9SPHN